MAATVASASALAAGLKDGGRLADGDYSALSQWRYTVNGQAVSGDWTAWQAGAQGQAAMADFAAHNHTNSLRAEVDPDLMFADRFDYALHYISSY